MGDKKLMALILLLVIGLAACAPDPRNQADANRTEALTAQDVADRTQARAVAESQATLDLAQAQATSQARTQALTTLIYWAGIIGTIAACASLLAAGAGISWAAVGTGRSVARLAEIRANLISLSAETRQYPLIMQYLGKGRYTLANPNTGSVAELDTRRAEDRQLISVSGAVQLAGVIAHEARRSADPAGVAIIRPVVITGGPNDENL